MRKTEVNEKVKCQPKCATRPSQSRLFLTCFILVVFICGVSVGIIGHRIIPLLGGQAPAVASQATVDKEVQATLSPLNLQLMERIKDAIGYLNIILALIGILTVALGISLGFSIWKTERYAKRLINEYFLAWKDKALQPILEKSRTQLENFNNQGIRLHLEASRLLLNNLSQITQETYRHQLELSDTRKEDATKLLQERKEWLRVSRDVTLYLLASLSRDEMIVQDACQKLFTLASHEVVRSRADFILSHLRHLLSSWGSGTPARIEIQRLIDEIERRVQDRSEKENQK